MLADKCRNVIATGAEFCTAVDPSCLLHIGGGLEPDGESGCGRCTSREILAATGRRR